MDSEFQFSQEGHSQNIFSIHGTSSNPPLPQPPKSSSHWPALQLAPSEGKCWGQSCGPQMRVTRGPDCTLLASVTFQRLNAHDKKLLWGFLSGSPHMNFLSELTGRKCWHVGVYLIHRLDLASNLHSGIFLLLEIACRRAPGEAPTLVGPWDKDFRTCLSGFWQLEDRSWRQLVWSVLRWAWQ